MITLRVSSGIVARKSTPIVGNSPVFTLELQSKSAQNVSHRDDIVSHRDSHRDNMSVTGTMVSHFSGLSTLCQMQHLSPSAMLLAVLHSRSHRSSARLKHLVAAFPGPGNEKNSEECYPALVCTVCSVPS